MAVSETIIPVAEVAEVLDVSPAVVRDSVRHYDELPEGDPDRYRYIPGVFIGKQVRIPRVRFVEWLEGRRQGPDVDALAAQVWARIVERMVGT